MAGVGEASAIVSVLQAGFSLATALNTYLSDVSDAADDISSLVSDIEATFCQLRDLGKLIRENEITKRWSEDGLCNAKICMANCERIIIKLRKQLKKSTASATSKEVSRDEIDISKLERAVWPFIKPQLEVRRKELQSIKQDIVIAHTSYMTQVGTDAERKKFAGDLPRLLKTRLLARRQVLEAKWNRQRHVYSGQRNSQSRPSGQRPFDDVPLECAWGYDGNGVSYPVNTPGRSFSDDGRALAPGNDDPLIYETLQDLVREVERLHAEDEKSKAYKEAERKLIEEEAVQTWKEQQLRDLEVRRQKIEDQRSSLRVELAKQRVPPQQMEDIINHVHPQEQISSDLQLLNANPTSDNTSSAESSNSQTKAKSSSRWSIWPRKSSSSSSTTSTLVNEPLQTPIADVLKDPTAKGGIAPLVALYFKRSLGVPPSVENFDVRIPDQWRLESLIKKEAAVAQNPKEVNSVWKDFSQLPNDYQYAISHHVRDKSDPGRRDNMWVLLHLDCIFEKRRRGMFGQGSRKEVVGIYVVLKQNRKPEFRSARDEDDERKKDHHHHRNYDSRGSRHNLCWRNNYYLPAQHKFSNSSYEPRYSQTYSEIGPFGSINPANVMGLDYSKWPDYLYNTRSNPRQRSSSPIRSQSRSRSPKPIQKIKPYKPYDCSNSPTRSQLRYFTGYPVTAGD